MVFDVLGAASRASALGTLDLQADPAPAHPADYFGGIAEHQGEIGNIFGDHSPRADKAIGADGMAAENGGIGADGGAFLNQSLFEFVHPGNAATRIYHIGEDH